MNATNRLGMGGNMPPLAERLDLDHASLAQQAGDVLALEALPPIFDDADLEAYSERAKALKGVVAMVEKARKAEKDQILRDGRTVDDHFKALAKPVEEAAAAVIAAINGWQRQKLEAERAAQRQREAEERAAATPFDDAPSQRQHVPRPAEAARVVTSAGRVAAVARTIWRHRVTDPTQLPRQYLMPNDAAIKAAIAGGVRSIAGVEIFEDVQTAIRS